MIGFHTIIFKPNKHKNHLFIAKKSSEFRHLSFRFRRHLVICKSFPNFQEEEVAKEKLSQALPFQICLHLLIISNLSESGGGGGQGGAGEEEEGGAWPGY